MKKQRFEEEEAEASVLATRIPDDKECLISFIIGELRSTDFVFIFLTFM